MSRNTCNAFFISLVLPHNEYILIDYMAKRNNEGGKKKDKCYISTNAYKKNYIGGKKKWEI